MHYDQLSVGCDALEVAAVVSGGDTGHVAAVRAGIVGRIIALLIIVISERNLAALIELGKVGSRVEA